MDNGMSGLSNVLSVYSYLNTNTSSFALESQTFTTNDLESTYYLSNHGLQCKLWQIQQAFSHTNRTLIRASSQRTHSYGANSMYQPCP